MFTKYGLPILALLGFFFAVRTVIVSSAPVVPAPPVAPPAITSFKNYIAGAGIVEASTENVAISTNVAGVVTDVYVVAGQKVKAGDSLFKVDVRQEEANLEVLLASAEVARVNSLDTQAQYEMVQGLNISRAASRDEISKKKFAAEAARAKLAQTQADIAAAKTLIDRHTVKSPIDGEVLQVKIRVGEYAQAGVLQIPLMILGDTEILHVRVDVDENDAWRIKQGASAEAFMRGNAKLKTAIGFVRFEPYVIPKKSLTGESMERVDTRVLQVIYKFERSKIDAFVGQLMDVYIEAEAIQ